VLIVSFGGPEGMEDVLPFLDNVLRGRNVPRERLLEVAEHYYHFNGISPINSQCRALIAALRMELATNGPDLPIYWGNRNWQPLLADTLATMARDGRRHALAFITSAYSSYSACRQYQEEVAAARAVVGDSAPRVQFVRRHYNHPGFIGANADRVRSALQHVPADRRDAAALVFTAHSVPVAMARSSSYEQQLHEAARLVAGAVGVHAWDLAYQSRSGPPAQPWLEPDIRDHLRDLAGRGVRDAVVSPIGFVSDHLEVLYDLDIEAQALARELGISMVRTGTAGTHPAYVAMIRELIGERTAGLAPRWLGDAGASPETCVAGCCAYVAARPSGSSHAQPAGVLR
jgi:ferrochelatase